MRIVRGNPTPEEVAALVVALALVQRAAPPSAPGNTSAAAWRGAVPEVTAGPWRDWSSGWRDVLSPSSRAEPRTDRAWTRLVG
jgi:hypothetical protein